jgi:hypothetical protein
MTTSHTEPTLRESVDELDERLDRIGASATILRNLAADICRGVPSAALVKATEDLDRDLILASQELDAVHARAINELSSLRDRSRTCDSSAADYGCERHAAAARWSHGRALRV